MLKRESVPNLIGEPRFDTGVERAAAILAVFFLECCFAIVRRPRSTAHVQAQSALYIPNLESDFQAYLSSKRPASSVGGRGLTRICFVRLIDCAECIGDCTQIQQSGRLGSNGRYKVNVHRRHSSNH